MVSKEEIRKKLEGVFPSNQAEVLGEVIYLSYESLVKRSDFNDLKAIVKELAEAQKRTETRLEELAEAQKKTETRLEELAEAQKKTETRLEELAEAQKRTEKEIENLTMALKNTNKRVGGLSRTLSYGFENEAFRMLPGFLEKTYGIQVKEKFIRTKINGREINILGKGKKNGRDIIIIGEAKMRLEAEREEKKQEIDEKDIWEQLDEIEEVVRQKYRKEEIQKIIITHYADPEIIKEAKRKGIIIIQSFEW